MPYVNNYNPTLRWVKGSELEWIELDDNFENISLELSSISTAITAAELNILALQQATGISTVVIQNLTDLLDVDSVAPAMDSFLSFNGISWTPKASPALTALGFNTATGTLTATSNIGTVSTNLDGRYVRSINGILPVSGNVALNLTATETGTLAARPATATNGVIYVVSNDTIANNGKTYVYVTTGTPGWYQVIPFDVATNDAKYAPINSASLTGNVSLTSATASSAFTITQTGAGNALTVNDDNPDSSPFVINSSGDVGIGVSVPSVKLDVDGVINAGNGLQISGSLVTSSAAELNKLSGTPIGLTSTELGYVDGVTSPIQTQLNNKAPKDSPVFTTSVTISGPLNLGTAAPGTIGQVLTSAGPGLTPTWTTPSSSSSSVSYETFTASGTWTKPAGISPNAIVKVQIWGAGGGGGRMSNYNGNGGGGGGYNEYIAKASDLPATVVVTVGLGGLGKTSSYGNGAAGGTSSFGVYQATGGSGGGGSNTGTNPGDAQGTGGDAAKSGVMFNTFIYTGGSTTYPNVAFGGGAGAAFTGLPAGISGYGGDGGTSAVNGGVGNAPGGGGAGNNTNTNGSDGARGEVRITIVG